MHKRTKALAISKAVKDAVFARDGCCILCRSPFGQPNAHYISRAQGGLGIEENIVTLCVQCHDAYDNSDQRWFLRASIRDYLLLQYSNWDETKLVYQKQGGSHV